MPEPDAVPTDDVARYNWSRTYRYRARGVHHPRSVEELQRMVVGADRIRALGTRHSFNDIADSHGQQVCLDEMPARVEVDPATRTAIVPAGLPYSAVAEHLDAAGFALTAMASLPHISVAGACATGTHGSGDRVGGLATAVIAAQFVDGRGDVVRVSRAGDPDAFPGMVVSLGALGVMTELTLAVVPSYQVAQTVRVAVPAATLIDGFEEVYRSADSVSCFTRWRNDTVDQVWLKRRVSDGGNRGGGGGNRVSDGGNRGGGGGNRGGGGADVGSSRAADPLARARFAAGPVNPVPGGNPADCTEQGGVPGPWYDRLPHFRAGHHPSAGDEIQSEYFVRRDQAPAAIRALFGIGAILDSALQIAEIRTIATDDLWLSPAYQRDVVAFHFTWIGDAAAVRRVLPDLEAALAPFDAVPHWGKVFAADPGVFRRRYRRLPDFVELARAHDPRGRFRNDFLDRYVFG